MVGFNQELDGILSKSENKHQKSRLGPCLNHSRSCWLSHYSPIAFHHNQAHCYLYVPLALLDLTDFCLLKLPVVLKLPNGLFPLKSPPIPPIQSSYM